MAWSFGWGRFRGATFRRRIHTSCILQGGRTSEKRGKWKAKQELERIKPPPPLKIGSSEYADRLKRCSGDFGLGYAKITHERIIDAKRDQEKETYLGNVLVRTYGRCKSIDDAVAAFKDIADKNVYSYAIMMGAYQENGLWKKALKVFNHTIDEELEQNQATYVAALKSCAHLGVNYLREGKNIHRLAIAGGYGSDLVVQNSLIHMYAKCGSLSFAEGVFQRTQPKNVITFTAITQAYTHAGQIEEAYRTYKRMIAEGIRPDIYAYAAALAVCPTVKDGEAIHVSLGDTKRRCPVCSNALVSMYGRFGRIASARWVFDGIRRKDVVSYNSMISAHAKFEDGSQALKLYIEMEANDIQPNLWTFTSVLDACAKLGALTEGKEIQARVDKADEPKDMIYNTALVNMYAKCGSSHEARAVFNNMKRKSVISWTSLMSAYDQPGQAEERQEIYRRMHLEGLVLDEIAFSAVFDACRHSGLPQEGWEFFSSMRQDHWITPLEAHYLCIVELLGRVGRLKEAEELVNFMPFVPGVIPWTLLLSACKVYGDLKIATRSYKRISVLNPQDAGPYLLMGNIYAKAGRWTEMASVKKLMQERGLGLSQPGKSLIEAQRKIHQFVCGDVSHPLDDEIKRRLAELHEQMVYAGFVLDKKEVLADLHEEVKPEVLFHHSERMALGMGLLTTDERATLHIIKNLRMCPDCHSAFKMASKVLHRKIMVRDANRFHVFKRGSCSCGDYW